MSTYVCQLCQKLTSEADIIALHVCILCPRDEGPNNLATRCFCRSCYETRVRPSLLHLDLVGDLGLKFSCNSEAQS